MGTRTRVPRTVGLTLAVVAAGALATPAQAAPGDVEVDRRVEVIEVAGDVQPACDEDILYTGGTITITTSTVRTPSGAYHGQEHVRSSGVTAVGLTSGATYTDRLRAHFTFRSNPEYLATDAEDGSHGVLSRIDVRLVADSDEVRDLHRSFHFMLQRTEGPEQGPPVMVFERAEDVCV